MVREEILCGVFPFPGLKIVELDCRAAQNSQNQKRLVRKQEIHFCSFTLIQQNWYWPFQVQCHAQVACSSPFCSFQDQERRRKQWQRGQGSCRWPRRGTGRGTWGDRSRWTWPRSWEFQELHMRMCPPDLLNQIVLNVQRKWFYLWFQQPHYSMDAGTTQSPEKN